jgi:hypothetical protein
VRLLFIQTILLNGRGPQYLETVKSGPLRLDVNELKQQCIRDLFFCDGIEQIVQRAPRERFRILTDPARLE